MSPPTNPAGKTPPKILWIERDKVMHGSPAKNRRFNKHKAAETLSVFLAHLKTGIGFPSCPREKQIEKMKEKCREKKI